MKGTKNQQPLRRRGGINEKAKQRGAYSAGYSAVRIEEEPGAFEDHGFSAENDLLNGTFHYAACSTPLYVLKCWQVACNLRSTCP
ncbi:hypothetical protein TNIN_168341 [Trichonephila inaurata madagascariensis]|uniref:Uncharacterized protein n=1 Tax=Trichonephila inaurata madagascariensis TaxID=2747483 RepID=A0A8X6IHG0_9ARAC|nr:hypothetical protein TNIN_78991 [Trichonephila inaurata madagascariensis]GFY42940.1 hypothetical protein TNIN_142281 [Trichonephila inaurata madagascariensis]GFY73897.1 hypothetical protein TNIN_168341 [Trichonephila inaurata madagascariensis]